MTGLKGRSERKIILVERRLGAALAPVDYCRNGFVHAVRWRAEGQQEAGQIVRRGLVQVVFGGLGDYFDLGFSGGEGHGKDRRGGVVELSAPLHVEEGAFERAGGQVVGADTDALESALLHVQWG